MLEGRDVVAYRESPERAIPGDADFAVTLEGGFVFWFATANHRNRFVEEPAAFLPRLGALCALGMSGGDPRHSSKLDAKALATIPVDPDAYHVDQRGKLLLFRGIAARDFFLQNNHNDSLTDAAEANWHTLLQPSPTTEAPTQEKDASCHDRRSRTNNPDLTFNTACFH